MAWPFGLVGIGVFNYVMSMSDKPRVSYKAEMITFCYLFQGLRMSFGAIFIIFVKKIWKTDTEIQRYQFARDKHEAETGKKWGTFDMQYEIFLQCLSNFCVLVLPGMLVCNDRNPLTSLEIVGFVMWALSYGLETISDGQKQTFIVMKAKAKERGAVCNTGFWRYSRHPNYFGEWMIWNSLCIFASQSVLNLDVVFEYKLACFLCFVLLSFLMFWCLILWTGTKPAEAGSLKRRPGYKAY